MLINPLTKSLTVKSLFFHEHTTHMSVIPDSTLI